WLWFFVFFFFQAEDGIRDLIVTGVQTCALPISLVRGSLRDREAATNASSSACSGSTAGAFSFSNPNSGCGPGFFTPMRRASRRRSEERRVGKECRSGGAPDH